MIEKMKFLSITGPKNDIDRIANVYFHKYKIHLENALSELNSIHDLTPFIESNPYKELLNKSQELYKRLSEEYTASKRKITTEEAVTLLKKAIILSEQYNLKKEEVQKEEDHLRTLLEQIRPFRSLDFNLKKIFSFRFIKFRFGKIPCQYYEKFSKYTYESMNTVFYECESDNRYVWGVYFVPAASSVKVDAILSSLHFDRVRIPDEYEGTAGQAYQSIYDRLQALLKKRNELSNDLLKELSGQMEDILCAYDKISDSCHNFDIRKLAACTKEREQVFYILCGWMSEKDTTGFLKEIEQDDDVYCLIDDSKEGVTPKPPTKLKNPKLFKPFELFTKMYGLPAYNEIDPTIFVALTYSFMFGMMFGDAGQGIFLVVGGFLLYKFKKMNLAAIISCAGIFSTIFGFLYGSIFGYEDILEPIWTNPMKDTMTVLYTAIGFGVFLILAAMILNIINGIRSRNISKIIFDTNGISGLIFYLMAISVVLLAITGHGIPSTIILIIGFGIPLLLIFLKEPLIRLLEKKKTLIPGKKGMFFLESFFELFEVLLSYITNTVSFVRVGAFALSHAGMMSVVLMLGNAASNQPNLFIIVLGNLFVAALEGLIVGIQVLRLEYYEMFSRFYNGTGKEFKPY